MKKSELERQRQAYALPSHNNSTTTDALRARVSSELNVVKDAYDTGSQALTELNKLISLKSGELDSKELANLAKAYADISRTLIALRDEGRTTIREAQAVDPPGPEREVMEAELTTPAKISSPRATPLAIGQYLQGLNPAPAEKDDENE